MRSAPSELRALALESPAAFTSMVERLARYALRTAPVIQGLDGLLA